MRRMRIKALRRLIALNLVLVQECCGLEDLGHTCKDCEKFINLIDWMLYRIANRTKQIEGSALFRWTRTQHDQQNCFMFEMVAQNTKESVKILIRGNLFEGVKSARKLKRLDSRK